MEHLHVFVANEQVLRERALDGVKEGLAVVGIHFRRGGAVFLGNGHGNLKICFDGHMVRPFCEMLVSTDMLELTSKIAARLAL